MLSNQISYLREVRESQKVFSDLVNAMEKSHKAVVSAIEEKQKEEEKRVEMLVRELKLEIQELSKDANGPDPEPSGDQRDATKKSLTVSSSRLPQRAGR